MPCITGGSFNDSKLYKDTLGHQIKTHWRMGKQIAFIVSWLKKASASVKTIRHKIQVVIMLLANLRCVNWKRLSDADYHVWPCLFHHFRTFSMRKECHHHFFMVVRFALDIFGKSKFEFSFGDTGAPSCSENTRSRYQRGSWFKKKKKKKFCDSHVGPKFPQNSMTWTILRIHCFHSPFVNCAVWHTIPMIGDFFSCDCEQSFYDFVAFTDS